MFKEAGNEDGQSRVIQNCCAGLRHVGSNELQSRRTRRPCRGVPCPSQPMWIPSRIWPQRQVIDPCTSFGWQKSPTMNCARTSGSFATWHRPGAGRWDTHACQLCLLDALAGTGYVGVACVIEHEPETPRLVFDNRKPMSKKAYFR